MYKNATPTGKSDNFYPLQLFDYAAHFRFNDHFAHELEARHNQAKSRAIRKEMSDAEFRVSYLEHNAQTRGDLDYKINLSNVCRRTGIWFQGKETQNQYLKLIDCRKLWCPECGGKNGRVHKSRIHSILNRVDLNKYNIRQFVFTIPEHLREHFSSRDGLNELFKYVKSVIEKHFGIPIRDKHGHVKKYKLQNGVIAYLHVFGDQTPGVFKAHINIHIFEEDLTAKLKLSSIKLDAIKKSWLKKMQKFDSSLDAIDVHYEFATQIKKKMHVVKYMSRPWGPEDFLVASQDESLKRLLVEDLSGFSYLRFWGDLANCNFKDEMDISDIIHETETKIYESIVPIGSPALVDVESYGDLLVKLEDGLYMVASYAMLEIVTNWRNGKFQGDFFLRKKIDE